MKALSNAELIALLQNTESERVERKEIFSRETRDSVRMAVCAFANDLGNSSTPAVLFIGARDSGQPSGIRITDELLRSLSDIKTDGNILPQPVLSVQKRNLLGADMAIVQVLPSDMPPVRYKGRIWIRVGPRNAVASGQDERILNEKRRSKNIPFDLQAVPQASIHDFSRASFEDEYLPRAYAPDILEANNRSYTELLASTRMIVSTNEPTPTVLGVLTLAKHAHKILYGAYIQFIRIAGYKLSDPVINAEEVSGTIIRVLDRIKDIVTAHNMVGYEIANDSKHTLHKLYPPTALLQIIYNAVMHRNYEGTNAPVHVQWYNDRVEVISPGGPYGEVNPQNFGTPGVLDYRNPNIAATLKDLDYIQRFGQGIPLARSEMAKNGNPALEFQVNSQHIRCILPRKEKHFAEELLR